MTHVENYNFNISFFVLISDQNDSVEGPDLPPLQSSKPEVALEWSDVTIKFRVMSSPDAEEFDLYPNLDVSAPSARSVIMQQRLHKRKQGTYFFLNYVCRLETVFNKFQKF